MSISKDLVNVIKESGSKGTKAYDTQATVTRVEGSVAWVHIPGGVDETPVRKTLNAREGDSVQVRVSGGRAWITGNSTNPPTDDAAANSAARRANQVAQAVSTFKEIVTESFRAVSAKIGFLEVDTAKIHNLTADQLTASVGYIEDLTAEHITAGDISADHATVESLETSYAKIDAANIDKASIREAWVENLMVQTGLIAHAGTVFELDAIQVNASRIKTGTLDVERLIVTVGNEKYMVHIDPSTGSPTYQKVDANVLEDLTITADKIVAGAITAEKITAENIVGTNGWINLHLGRFFYGNASTWAASTQGIMWDGQGLKIKGDVNITAGNVYTKTQSDNALAGKVGNNEVISKINASSEGVQIAANRVNIEGATIFSSGRLSTSSLDNAYDSKGSASAAETAAKKYTDNNAYKSVNITGSTADRDLNNYKTTGIYHCATSMTNAPLTNHGTVIVDWNVGTKYQEYHPDNLSYYYKRTWSGSAWNTWTKIDAVGAQATADAAAPKTSAIKRTQRIYYQSNSTTAPATPGTASSNWVTDKTGAANKWTLKRMSYAKATPYIWTCEQKETVSGAVSYTDVLLDDTTTVIDGGKIITGSIAANRIDAASGTFNTANIPDLSADKIKTGTIAIGRLPSDLATDSEVATAKSAAISAAATDATTKANNAAKTATNYITNIDSNRGITIKPQDSSGNDYLQINSSALDIYRNGQPQLSLQDSWVAIGNQGGTRITMHTRNDSPYIYMNANGKDALRLDANGITLYDPVNSGKKRTLVNSTGLHIYDADGSTETAFFGATARIGNAASTHISISSGSISFRNQYMASGYRPLNIIVGDQESIIVKGGANDRPHITLGFNAGSTGGGYLLLGAGTVDLNSPQVLSTRSADVLWTGAWYMSDGQTIDFGYDVISHHALNGIILVWSNYQNGAAQNAYFNYIVVPKWHIQNRNGCGVSCFLTGGPTLDIAGNKYVYVHADKIVGHASNTATGTSASGIKYTNNRFVLRQVLRF